MGDCPPSRRTTTRSRYCNGACKQRVVQFGFQMSVRLSTSSRHAVLPCQHAKPDTSAMPWGYPDSHLQPARSCRGWRAAGWRASRTTTHHRPRQCQRASAGGWLGRRSAHQPHWQRRPSSRHGLPAAQHRPCKQSSAAVLRFRHTERPAEHGSASAARSLWLLLRCVQATDGWLHPEHHHKKFFYCH